MPRAKAPATTRARASTIVALRSPGGRNTNGNNMARTTPRDRKEMEKGSMTSGAVNIASVATDRSPANSSSDLASSAGFRLEPLRITLYNPPISLTHISSLHVSLHRCSKLFPSSLYISMDQVS